MVADIERPDRRRFTLIDMMLLVAAVTPSLVLLRIAKGLKLFADMPGIAWDTHLIETITVIGGCVLVPMTFIVLVLSLLDRRTDRRDVIQGAGFFACVAIAGSAVFALAFLAIRVATADKLNRPTEFMIQFNNYFGRVKYLAGPMILGGWLACALIGRQRPRPTWMDRLGVLIGICIVLLFLYPEVYHLVHPLLIR